MRDREVALRLHPFWADWVSELGAVPPHAVLVDEWVDEAQGLVVLEVDVVQAGDHSGEGWGRAGSTCNRGWGASVDHVEVLHKDGTSGGPVFKGPTTTVPRRRRSEGSCNISPGCQ
jgi:hypothetical protein